MLKTKENIISIGDSKSFAFKEIIYLITFHAFLTFLHYFVNNY